METAWTNGEEFLDIRERARVRVPVPVACSLVRSDGRGWFPKKEKGIGVVYDLSLKGARISSKTPLRPGDPIEVTFRLPTFNGRFEVEQAVVRWAKDHMMGVEFVRVAAASTVRLQRFLSISLAPAL